MERTQSILKHIMNKIGSHRRIRKRQRARQRRELGQKRIMSRLGFLQRHRRSHRRIIRSRGRGGLLLLLSGGRGSRGNNVGLGVRNITETFTSQSIREFEDGAGISRRRSTNNLSHLGWAFGSGEGSVFLHTQSEGGFEGHVLCGGFGSRGGDRNGNKLFGVVVVVVVGSGAGVGGKGGGRRGTHRGEEVVKGEIGRGQTKVTRVVVVLRATLQHLH